MRFNVYINERARHGGVVTAKHVVEIAGLTRSDTRAATVVSARHFRVSQDRVLVIPTPASEARERVDVTLSPPRSDPKRAARRRDPSGGFRIGSRGLEKPARTHLHVGEVVAMGASSSPTLIRITALTDDRIRYRRYGTYGDLGEKIIERWIGEDLIAQGQKTFTAQRTMTPQKWIDSTEDERRRALKGRLDPSHRSRTRPRGASRRLGLRRRR